MSEVVWRPIGGSLAALAFLVGLTGCSHLHRKPPADKYVFVIAKQMYLVDRVAAVSNRTGEVTNGEKLTVLEHARKFVKVQTPKGEVGWIKEDKVADQAMADKFEDLRTKHLQDPTVGQATARDEVYLHVAPGRETDRFFLLQEGDKLSLLQRAMVVKPLPPGAAVAAAVPRSRIYTHGPAGSDHPVPTTSNAETAKGGDDTAVPEAPPAMEDWWLVRDAKGDTGWIYSHLIDVDAPDALARYAEGQRIVGAYLLAHVDDPDSGMVENGQPVTSIPEYVTVLGPYKAGLPYDFDQVRVFTWNVKKHRYETAYREHNIAGYLPVTLSMQRDPYGKSVDATTPMPAFSYKVLAGDVPIPQPDPQTGALTPGATVTKTYRLEGNVCRRILAPGMPAPAEAHPVPEVDKKDKAKKGRKK